LAAGFPGLGLVSTFAGSALNAQFMVKDPKKTPRPAAEDSPTLHKANPVMRHYTQSASPATRLQKTVTTFSLATHVRPEPKDAPMLGGIKILFRNVAFWFK
jgi:hypothetical protein